tara:strand:- start:16975 stop:18117 length:1143 start_codon:yes stop_codon:yes gene_type:complete
MKIFYWSPFLSNIATVDAVIRSINCLKRYDREKKIIPFIIDSSGEWKEKKDKINGINIIELYKKSFFESLPKGGYLKSRLSQIIIFVKSFSKLKTIILDQKPDFLIAHLIISLPLLLFSISKFETKLIIRISGTPKLNFIRRFFWSIFSKNIYKVTCPTISTYNKLKELNIFPVRKLEIMYDPVISVKHINKKKNEPLNEELKKIDYIIGIGRLTRQKNFKILIEGFNEINKKIQNLNLVILGEGEERKLLEKLIYKYNLDKKVHLIGYKDNIFNYLNNAKCFICPSLYEDPGFVIIEAGYLNKPVIAADSNTGPSDILDNSNRGFLFETNNSKDLEKKFFEFLESDKRELTNKSIKLKKHVRNYTIFSHYKKLRNLLIT